MSFKRQPHPTFKTKVQMSQAGDEAKPWLVEVEYRYKRKSEVKEYFDGLSGKKDAEALAEIIAGWSEQDMGQPYEGADSIDALIEEFPAAAFDLFEAYRRELLEAKRKNL